MYLLLFLLISPAFGTSISAKLDLARRTVSEVRDLKMLLEDHDRDSDSLEASVGKMQDLVVTLKGNLNKTLEEAHQSLDQARTMDLSTEERSETFDNLKEEIDLVQNWANSALFVSKCIDRFPAEYLEKFQFVRYMFKTSLDDLKNSAQLAEQFLARRRKEAVDGLQETAYEQLRGDLVQLADRTETEVRGLKIVLEDLDTGNLSVLFEIKMTSMKELTIETLGRLKEAGGSAIEALDDETDEDYLTEEINQIRSWTRGALVVKKMLDQYPPQYFKKYGSFRTIFKNSLDDLKTYAEQFVA